MSEMCIRDRNEGMAIADIFKEKGEPYFRELETDLIKSFAGVEPAVISCGGGAVLKEENVRLMKESGKIVLLTAEPETIYERVKDSTERPVLNGNMNVGYIDCLLYTSSAYKCLKINLINLSCHCIVVNFLDQDIIYLTLDVEVDLTAFMFGL